MVINYAKKTMAMQQESSMLWKQIYEDEGKKKQTPPKHGCFQELQQEIVESVLLKRKTGVPIMR
jgi:hypothetical protein